MTTSQRKGNTHERKRKDNDKTLRKAAEVLMMPPERKYEVETGMPYWLVELRPTTSPRLWWVSWFKRGQEYSRTGHTTWFRSKAQAQRFIAWRFTRKARHAA